MPESKDPLWRKLDEHTTKIAQIDKEQAAIGARQTATENRLDHIVSAQAESKASADAHHEAMMKEIRSLNESINKAKGGLRFGMWIFGAVTVLSGIVVAVWRNLQGG